MAISITASVLGFALSLLVTTVATYVSTSLLTDSSSIGYSLITALLTSGVWFLVTYFISGVVGVSGFVVALGPALAVVAYILTVDVLYPGGIVRAAAIAGGTWTTTFVILAAAAYYGYSSFQALGVPPSIV